MPSQIDPTKPVFGSPTTESVRANFLAAKNEIEALQAKTPSALPLAATTPAPTEVAVQQNGQWVRATWPQIVSWVLLAPSESSQLTTEDGLWLVAEDGTPLTSEGTAATNSVALLTSNRLSEFALDATAQEDAQRNLGLDLSGLMAALTAAMN